MPLLLVQSTSSCHDRYDTSKKASDLSPSSLSMHEKFKLFLAFISLPRRLRNMILKFWPFYSRIFAFWACSGPLSPVRAHHHDSGNHLEQTHAIAFKWFLKSHPLRDTPLLPKKIRPFRWCSIKVFHHLPHESFYQPLYEMCSFTNQGRKL